MTHRRLTTIAVVTVALIITPLVAHAATASPQDANVAGNWTLIVQAPNGSDPADLVFTQEGTTLGGTVETPQGILPLEGKVEGNDITFSVSIDMQGSVFTVTFAGTVAENTKISGTVSSADAEMTAPFTAEKKEGRS